MSADNMVDSSCIGLDYIVDNADYVTKLAAGEYLNFFKLLSLEPGAALAEKCGSGLTTESRRGEGEVHFLARPYA